MKDKRILELQREGMALYMRCEKWKKALERIRNLTDDPVILREIKKTFGE